MASVTRFGLGTDGSQQAQVGSYHVQYEYSTLKMDGLDAQSSFSTDNGVNWNLQDQYFSFNKTPLFYQGFHVRGAPGKDPMPAKNITVKLVVDAYLNKKADFPKGSRVPLQGLATIVMSYIS